MHTPNRTKIYECPKNFDIIKSAPKLIADLKDRFGTDQRCVGGYYLDTQGHAVKFDDLHLLGDYTEQDPKNPKVACAHV